MVSNGTDAAVVREIDLLNEWVLNELPGRNAAVLAGEVSLREFTALLNQHVLGSLPDPARLSAEQAKRVLVLIGLCGSSVARHTQEADLFYLDNPHLAFAPLVVGPGRAPFRSYFADVVTRTGTGHPQRDSYVALTRWNTPTSEALWEGVPIAVLRGAFGDGRTRSYLGDPGEAAFFQLAKREEVLESAVNAALEPVFDGRVPPTAPAAVAAMRRATTLLAVIQRISLDFAGDSSENRLGTDFFLDILRQFAIHWDVGDLPPSGAADPEYLVRDFLLGIDYPGYDQHVLRIFPALLDEERARLRAVMGKPPIPLLLLRDCGVSEERMRTAEDRELRALVARYPAIAVAHQLLTVNCRVASAHLMLSEKYLFKPNDAREAQGIPDSPTVSNRMGTTGMIRHLLRALTKARRNHVLAALDRLPHREIADLAGVPEAPRITTDEVPRYVRWNEQAQSRGTD